MTKEIKFSIEGDIEGGPPIFLHGDKFSYAGKFITKDAGKILARIDEEVVGAISFNKDRNDEDIGWIRYMVVEKDHRGEGIGPELITYAIGVLRENVGLIKVATNNIFAYRALYKSGFAYTGKTTGIAELVLEYPKNQTMQKYIEGVEHLLSVKNLTEEEIEFFSNEDIKNIPTKKLFSF